jgi:hypothetical protein
MGHELTGFIWHNTEQCQDLASMAMKFCVPISTAIFLSIPTTVSWTTKHSVQNDSKHCLPYSTEKEKLSNVQIIRISFPLPTIVQ